VTNDLLLTEQLCELLGVDERTLLRWRQDGCGPLSNDVRNEAGDDTENEATLCHAVVSVAAGALAFWRSPARRFSRSR